MLSKQQRRARGGALTSRLHVPLLQLRHDGGARPANACEMIRRDGPLVHKRGPPCHESSMGYMVRCSYGATLWTLFLFPNALGRGDFGEERR